jgi:uncharacterized protein with ParB-like and HNH nuclease domain
MPTFKEIPQFPHSRYQADIDWDLLEDWLARKRNYPGLNLEPEYQRGYVWTLDQKTSYVEYILRGGQSGRDLYFNCPSWQKGYDTPLEIVDGKQRLSAVLDFLQNRIKAFGKLCNEYTDKPRQAYFKIHVNVLKTQKEILDWYIGMNTGGSIHTEKDLEPAYKLKEKLEKL